MPPILELGLFYMYATISIKNYLMTTLSLN